MFSSSKSIATAATMLLLASFGVSAPVIAADADAGAVATCASGTRVVFRPTGHPAKSMVAKRHEVSAPRGCSGAARKALMLASFVDSPGGAALVAGQSDRAIKQISASRKANLSANTLTNLCVAHTVARDWSQAPDACDAAVAAALDARKRSAIWPRAHLERANKAVAVAYSNRAVMHWLSRDSLASGTDLARARAIAPKANFVVRNSEMTGRIPTDAQVRREFTPIG
jgi:hypothetical protein